MVIHIAHRKPWLGNFPVRPAKVLYIAREDPLRRIKERALEINKSYGFPALPTGQILFLIRERFNLMDESHQEWLTQQVQSKGFSMLILDVLNRMVPELDELSAKDMARMVSVLEQLNREQNLTLLLLDHTRKPVGPRADRDKQRPNPFDLKGSVAKYGAADFMLCLSRTEQPSRLQLYCENKDSDDHPSFLIDVSPKGSGAPKFTYAGDVRQLAADRKELGQDNREKVLDALDDSWKTPKEIVETTGFSPSTVRNHLTALKNAGQAEREGQQRGTKWRRKIAETT
jgi:DNA-binding transcriptional ArsR family regulator